MWLCVIESHRKDGSSSRRDGVTAGISELWENAVLDVPGTSVQVSGCSDIVDGVCPDLDSLIFELVVIEHLACAGVLLELWTDIIFVARVLVRVKSEGSTATGLANLLRGGTWANTDNGERIILLQRYIDQHHGGQVVK